MCNGHPAIKHEPDPPKPLGAAGKVMMNTKAVTININKLVINIKKYKCPAMVIKYIKSTSNVT